MVLINDNETTTPPSSRVASEMTDRVKYSKVMTIIVIMTACFLGVALANLRVTIKQGSIIGTEKTNRLTNEPYYAFLGIPYAKPPVGVLRFKDPEDPLPWTGVFNATQQGRGCMSFDILTSEIKGHEDCLNLNVYTLKKPAELAESPRPVLVWIHGGAFMSGSGRPSDYGPDFLMRHDVVLVSINYRLNVFGFLSLQNDFVPGNAGLKDQVMALKWVQENIAAFGGDPNSVTLFGQSAGAVSVHYLILSPRAKGLFHRAISQSGVAINPWAYTRDTRKTALNLGNLLDCDTEDDYELIDCLQQVDPWQLLTSQFRIVSFTNAKFATQNINFPCLEPETAKNAFLTESPIKIMKAGNFNDVPYILGVMKFEALLIQKLFSESIPETLRGLILDQINLKPEFLLPQNVAPGHLTQEAVLNMKEFYFHNQTISRRNIDKVVNAVSEGWFMFGIHETAMLHSKYGKSPVYLYQFVLETGFGEPQKTLRTSITGPAHADDLKYFFYIWNKDINISPEEMKMISKINQLWINFAKFGNPTPDKNNSEVIWQPFTPKEKQYLEIGNKFRMKSDLQKESMQFWHRLTEEGKIVFL